MAAGDRAPDFTLPDDTGQDVSLASFAGKNVVLFVYPRANTPGCTQEAADFSALAPDFAKAKTVVLGLSADPPKTQERFKAQHGITIPLLSDEAHKVLKSYGAWGEKSMYGKIFEGILRTTFLIGKDGHILEVWSRVRVPGHAAAVLAAVRSLGKSR